MDSLGMQSIVEVCAGRKRAGAGRGVCRGKVHLSPTIICLQIVRQENLLRASGRQSHKPQLKPASQPAPVEAAAAREAASPFDHLAPGRRLQMSLPQSPAGPREVRGDLNGGKDGEGSASFTAAVLDVDEGTAKQAVRDCAVFIVPQVMHVLC